MDAETETVLTFHDGTVMPLSWRDDADRSTEFQDALKRSHAAGLRPTCGCKWDRSPLEIVLRRLQSGRYIVACMPNEGQKHEKECAFHRSDPNESGEAAYVSGVIEERDGITKIHLESSLQFGVEHVPDPRAELFHFGIRDGAERQRAMTPLGLLHLLWQRAQFNYWKPGFLDKRTPNVLANRLRAVAEAIECDDVPLDEQFVMIRPKAWSEGKSFQKRAKHVENKRYFVISALIDEMIYNDRRSRWDIKLVGGLPAYGLFLSCNTPTQERIFRSFPYAANLLKQSSTARSGKVVGLFVVEVRTTDQQDRTNVNAIVFSAGLMATTNQFIPVESGLEHQVANKLVRERRTFEKPLRYDADEDLVFPDFKLLDTGHSRGFPMEVFGRSDKTYRKRQAAKKQYYAQMYGRKNWWHWIAAGPEKTEMPSFEPAARSTNR